VLVGSLEQEKKSLGQVDDILILRDLKRLLLIP
jgi:hypothetical protein